MAKSDERKLPSVPVAVTLTDAQLYAEVFRREQIKYESDMASRCKRSEFLRNSIDTLLSLIVSHSCCNDDCTDSKHGNGYIDHGVPRCVRCWLLDMHSGSGDDWPDDLDITIQIIKLPDLIKPENKQGDRR